MSNQNIYQGQDQFRLVIGGDTYIIREPEGWDQFLFVLGRSKKFSGFVQSITDDITDLLFDEFSGVQYVIAAYEDKGVEAIAELQFGGWDGATFDLYFSGFLDFTEFQRDKDGVRLGLIGDPKRQKLAARTGAKFNVEGSTTMDNIGMVALTNRDFVFHSKVLEKVSRVTKSETSSQSSVFLPGRVNGQIGAAQTKSKVAYAILGLDYLEKDELHDMYTYNEIGFEDDNFINSLFIYKAKERGDHSFVIDLNITPSMEILLDLEAANGDPAESSWDETDCLLRIEVVLNVAGIETVLWSDETTVCTDTVFAPGATAISDTVDAFMEQNQTALIFVRYTFSKEFSNFNNVTSISLTLLADLAVNQQSSVTLQALTETQYSVASAMLVHEVFDKVLEGIISEANPLRSKFLGRPEIGYEEMGCGAKYILTNGKKIRALADNQLVTTLDDMYNSLDAIFCLGLGIEKSDGKYFCTVELSSDTIITTFLIPYFDQSLIEVYLVSDNSLVATLDDIAIAGSGTLLDPYVYSGTGTFADLSSREVYIIVTSLVGKEIVRVEQKEYFYKDALVLSIPAAAIDQSSYKESAKTDSIYNEAIIGYQKFPEGELNTLDEFNTKQEFLFPIGRWKNKFDKQSAFIASGYAIEFQRRLQFENEGTAAGQYDDDVFIVALTEENYILEVRRFESSTKRIYLVQQLLNEPAIGSTLVVTGSSSNNGTYTIVSFGQHGFLPKQTYVEVVESLVDEFTSDGSITYQGGEYSPERVQAFNSVTGIISPTTSYNLRISPRRMFHNWARFLNAGMFYNTGGELIKNTFTKNNLVGGGLSTQFKTGEPCLLGDSARQVLSESGDFTLSTFDGFNKYLKPTTIEFKARLDWEAIELILEKHNTESSNSYGYLEFPDLEGNTRKGHIMDMKYNPSLEMTEFVLQERN